MIKVMIAEDNKFLCKSCFEFLTNDEDIRDYNSGRCNKPIPLIYYFNN